MLRGRRRLRKGLMTDRETPLGGHLTELRRRLITSVLALLVSTVLAFVFYQVIFDVLMTPAQGFDSLRDSELIFIDMTEMIGVTMKVSLLTGVALALPIILYQVVMFIAPGLTGREKRYLYALLPVALLSFIAGASFGYFVLLPPALHFLLTFGSEIATPMIRIGNYINLVVTLLFWLGIAFETPLVMFFLSKIGVITPQALARQRRFALVGAFILGAMITPTFDPVNQSMVAVPIIILYELGILLARVARLGKKRDGIEMVPTRSPKG
jgi:sec-independent protein translocase protein TatC